ncbi:MAG: hypothetical protein OXC63_16230 [Aestuariivita sp.]|nr:hypothetical protein [Aestuariivita sp.]MCY4346496.1 hypothetical protein [Aestuariivita sp.]
MSFVHPEPMQSDVDYLGSVVAHKFGISSARHPPTSKGHQQSYATMLRDPRIVAAGSFDCHAFLGDLYRLGLDEDDIIDRFIPAAARALGVCWIEDALGFSDVTVGALRLQALLAESAYRYGFTSFLEGVSDVRQEVLIVSRAKEQHTLGCFVLAAQLRRRGANVTLHLSESDNSIYQRILGDVWDTVLFSTSCRNDLPKICALMLSVRRQISSVPLFALGGSFLDTCERGGCEEPLEGFDIVTNDLDRVINRRQHLCDGSTNQSWAIR